MVSLPTRAAPLSRVSAPTEPSAAEANDVGEVGNFLLNVAITSHACLRNFYSDEQKRKHVSRQWLTAINMRLTHEEARCGHADEMKARGIEPCEDNEVLLSKCTVDLSRPEQAQQSTRRIDARGSVQDCIAARGTRSDYNKLHQPAVHQTDQLQRPFAVAENATLEQRRTCRDQQRSEIATKGQTCQALDATRREEYKAAHMQLENAELKELCLSTTSYAASKASTASRKMSHS
eukprot:1893878-Pleurochrysis_carterae.AAC.1